MTVIGTLISDRFRLEEKIGSGGMSTVSSFLGAEFEWRRESTRPPEV